MTKAQQILELYGKAVGTMPEHRLPKFVAAQVGTSDAYVRTVARQRLGRGRSEAERRYKASSLGKVTTRRAKNAYFRKRYHGDPEFRAKEIARTRKRRAEASAS